MNSFKHLTRQDRYTIEVMLRNHHSPSEIASTLRVSPSTVSREVRRDGMTAKTYCSKRAQDHCHASRPPSPTSKPKELWVLAEEYLTAQQWSPEEISGYLKKHTSHRISHEAIYLHIYRDQEKGGQLYTHLRQKPRKRKRRKNQREKRGSIPHRVGIEERPAIVDEKKRLGDLEMDTMIGIQGGPVLVTMVDRASKYTFVALAASKRADDVCAVIVERLESYTGIIKTATYDNGKEFAYHDIVNQILGITSYFANPYHSWERGLNENTNGLIRQYFPKGTDFKNISPEELARVQDLLNSRPRKTLDYATPNDIFLAQSNVAIPS